MFQGKNIWETDVGTASQDIETVKELEKLEKIKFNHDNFYQTLLINSSFNIVNLFINHVIINNNVKKRV